MRKWGLVPLPGSLFAASQASAATGVAVLGGGSVAAKIAVAAVTATVVVGGGVTIEHRMSAPEPRSPAKEAPAGTHGSDGSAVVPVSATAAPRAAGVAISPVRRRVKAHGAPAPVRVRVRAKKTKKPHRGRDGVTSGQARPKEQGRARPVSPAASKPAKVKPVKAAKPAKTKPVRSKPVKVQPVRVKPVKRPSPPKLVKPRVPPAPPPVAAAPATQESSGSDDDRGKSKGDDGQHGDDGSSGRSKDG
jgi:hypothetical protein